MNDRYQFVCIAEHKKLEADIADEQAKFVQLGYKSWWSQARATAEGGVSGGTSIHAHRCFMGRRLDWSSLPKGRYLPAEPANWTAIVVRGYVNVIVVTAYFKDGIGMVGENIAMMAEISGWLLAAALPWVMVADWNTTPKLLQDSGVLDGLEAEILVPRDCAATCSMGSGRLIDFVAASKSMAPAIKVEADYMAPVRPHVAIRVHLNLKFFDDRIRVLAAPPVPQVLAMGKAQHRSFCGMPEDESVQAKRRKLPRMGAKTRGQLRSTQRTWKQTRLKSRQLLRLSPGRRQGRWPGRWFAPDRPECKSARRMLVKPSWPLTIRARFCSRTVSLLRPMRLTPARVW